MKKLLKTVFLITLGIMIMAPFIYASTNSKGTACAIVSSKRGGFESEGDRAMQNAKNTYDSMGYNTLILKDPGALILYSNIIASKVQLYCCHGSSKHIEFPNGGLCIGNGNSYDGKTFYSIDNLDLSNAKLITLAACNTAGNGSSSWDSIAAKMMERGAQMTIGWYTEVNPFSMPDWLDNFHKEINNGYDPLTALNKACNNYWYMNDNVKNILFSYKTLSTLSNNSELQMKISEKNILKEKKLVKLTETEIENKIKENDLTFDVKDYKKQYSDGIYILNGETNEIQHICSYIDYTLKIGDYITNSGYTVVLDKEENVQQIIDNTFSKKNLIITNRNNNNFLVSENDKNYYISAAKEKLEIKDKIIDENVEFYYDVNTSQKFANVTIKVEDKLSGFKLDTYVFKITD